MGWPFDCCDLDRNILAVPISVVVESGSHVPISVTIPTKSSLSPRPPSDGIDEDAQDSVSLNFGDYLPGANPSGYPAQIDIWIDGGGSTAQLARLFN